MYEEHFGLKSRPFGAKAEGAGVFVGPHQAKIMTSLTKGLAAADAVVTVTGPVGVGKTTIVSRALESISPGRMVAWVGRMQLAPDEVLELLLAGFGVGRQVKGTIQRFAAFRRLLGERAAAGAQVAIVVEDAHRIGVDALVELEALTAADTGDSTSANIILMGQAGLNKILASPDLARLSQRNRLRQKIDPFSDAEVTGYLKHCIRHAGGDYDTIFDSGVADIVARRSGGVPRVINTLCETAMTTAMEEGLSQVTTTLMRQVAADALGLEATQTNAIPAIDAQAVVAPVIAPAAPQKTADAGSVPESPAPQATSPDVPELIDDTQPELQQIDAGNDATVEALVEKTQTQKTLSMPADDEIGSESPDADFSLDAALSVEAEETNVMPGITPNLDQLAASAKKADAAELALTKDPTENIPTLSNSMRIDVDVEVERAKKTEAKSMAPLSQDSAPVDESPATPEPTLKPEPAPQPEREPLAVKPTPAPKPEPVAARPEPVPAPQLDSEAAKPEAVPKPAPVAPKPAPPVAGPKATPETAPVAAKPEPAPKPAPAESKPAPIAAEPKPAPQPEPVATKPDPVPKAAPADPKPAPIAAEPKPAPQPEPAAAKPEATPKPAPVVAQPRPVAEPEPVAAKPESVPKPETKTITAAPVTEAPLTSNPPDNKQADSAAAVADAWSGIGDDGSDETESVEEIDTSAEPISLVADDLTLPDSAEPAESLAPNPDKRMPDIDALEAALDAAKKGDFAIQPDSAPVADFADAIPAPASEQTDDAAIAVPEITLDNSLPQINADDDELRKVAEQIGSANSLEDVSDVMAETIFGSQALDEIAAAVVANPPQEAESPVMLEESVIAPAANDGQSEKPLPNGVAPAGNPAKLDQTATKRLDAVKAPNNGNGKAPAAKVEEIELGGAKAEPVAPKPTGPQPEPIENQINTSMTQTLQALSSAQVKNLEKPEEEKKSGGLFSRFRRSS